MTGVGSVARLPDFGWEEWLVIIAVILLALKLLLDALKRILFGNEDRRGTGHDGTPGGGLDRAVRDVIASPSRGVAPRHASQPPEPFRPPSGPGTDSRSDPGAGGTSPWSSRSGGDRTHGSPPPVREPGPYDGATFTITNIRISDSVINRSPIGGEDREEP